MCIAILVEESSWNETCKKKLISIELISLRTIEKRRRNRTAFGYHTFYCYIFVKSEPPRGTIFYYIANQIIFDQLLLGLMTLSKYTRKWRIQSTHTSLEERSLIDCQSVLSLVYLFFKVLLMRDNQCSVCLAMCKNTGIRRGQCSTVHTHLVYTTYEWAVRCARIVAVSSTEHISDRDVIWILAGCVDGWAGVWGIQDSIDVETLSSERIVGMRHMSPRIVRKRRPDQRSVARGLIHLSDQIASAIEVQERCAPSYACETKSNRY